MHISPKKIIYIFMLLGIVMVVLILYAQKNYDLLQGSATQSYGDIRHKGLPLKHDRDNRRETAKQGEAVPRPSTHVSDGQKAPPGRVYTPESTYETVATDKPDSIEESAIPDNVNYVENIRREIYERAVTDEFKKELILANPSERFTIKKGVDKSGEVVKVILMPHSHNDPGWLWTFDTYYTVRTASIFKNLVSFAKIEENHDMPFQWSESVSFLRWYKTASKEDQQVIKEAIKREQLLIDHGSWSMPDEASTTLYSLIENMILGHTWIYNEFNIKPEYSWSCDPFGHSSTLPYLLKQSGIKGMVINRIDMLVKRMMRERQDLEFFWRQMYDLSDDSNDILVHILPHALYNTADMITSNWTTGKRFDFSPSEALYRPLSSSDKITDTYLVKELAQVFSHEVHRMAAYYRHNVVLIPIGDDFRYIERNEFDGVHDNWNILIDFYKNNPQHKVELQFGSLKDYFQLLEEEVKKSEYPVYAGDFFPYCDQCDSLPKGFARPLSADKIDRPLLQSFSPRNGPWWTGYFTSHPYFKVTLRRFESMLRQTEILYSQLVYKALTQSAVSNITNTPPAERLSQARQTLTWLLHHDAITGTSPTATMLDYEKHLESEFANLKTFAATVITSLAKLKTSSKEATNKHVNTVYSEKISVLQAEPNVLLLAPDSKLVMDMVLLGDGDTRTFTVYNPAGHDRRSTIHIPLRINTGVKFIQLYQSNKKKGSGQVPCQINPFFNAGVGFCKENVELVFEIHLKALESEAFTLQTLHTSSDDRSNCVYPDVVIYAADDKSYSNVTLTAGFSPPKIIRRRTQSYTERIQIRTDTVEVTVSASNGTLLGVKPAEYTPTSVEQTFGVYNKDSAQTAENGLYIFSTLDDGFELFNTRDSDVIKLDGIVEKVVLSSFRIPTNQASFIQATAPLYQAIRINHISSGVSLSSRVNLQSFGDLFMRLKSDIASSDIFYTDSNSYTMVERQRQHPLLPIAADYYPITNAAFIENKLKRLTVLAGQPCGVTSLKSGHLEFMLDRKTHGNDHAGVQEPLFDGHEATLQFQLHVESMYDKDSNDPGLSLISFHHSQLLNSPPVVYTDIDIEVTGQLISKLPCDYQLINIRSLNTLPMGEPTEEDKQSFALILFRSETSRSKDEDLIEEEEVCVMSDDGEEEEAVTITADDLDIHKTSLSLLYTKEEVPSGILTLNKNNIQTLRLTLSKG